ncbi:bacterio-opsin activator domain-containing protein [Halosimplex sp. TS25]|uniref:helix-turn-helix domain-containing protein n=1 Tax=Halosimplex rarum TaxID=3396619 RepID=UPI0039E845F0
MSIFGEFRVPADAFAFQQTFGAEPDMVIEIERVVATDKEYLTPYFWVSGVTPETFEEAARTDDSFTDLRRLDKSEAMTMYRAEWQSHVESLVFAYTSIGASILEASGHQNEWVLRMRFDDQDNLNAFTEYLNEHDISFQLDRLHEITNPRTGEQFGLTPKQQEAIVTAWGLGYFDLPREASMAEVADELGITAQSFSDRLRRAQHTLVANTLRVTTAPEPADS